MMKSRIELIFLGTGTSSSLPHLDCITAPPNRPRCETCLSTLTPEGKKNIRRNTGAVLRITNASGRQTTVVCDVGKNFQAAAIEWFPKYGLRHIDAVVITHAHADAMNGLDDLRGWTLRGAIQPFIDVHVSQATFLEVQRAFPYLISKEFASGGGDVPEFKWHIFNDRIPFEIRDTGIYITPFPVHHGRIFSTPPPVHAPPNGLPTPEYTAPSTPTSDRSLPLPPTIQLGNDNFAKHDAASKPQPYISHGFKFLDSIVYISDVSFIPEESWQVILPSRQSGVERMPVFVVDCLRLNKHISHFGLREAVDAACRLNAQKTYLTGFGHEVSHDEYVSILQFAQTRDSAIVTAQNRPNIREGIKLLGDAPAPWSRPAFDGLKVVIDSDGVCDDYC